MSLKGNLGSVDLANIFQMLSINQKEGTLVIFDGQSRKSIYFSREGVSMLSRGSVRQDSLGRILLRYNLITPDQLQRALEKQSSSARLLGEILIEMGVITQVDVENALRVQIEEEIYNLFIWKNAEFEFIEGNANSTEDVPERPLTMLTFNVNSLIMEAARRIDEWECIRSRITSTRDIFRFTGRRADLSDEVFQTPFSDTVMQMIDGHANVMEIVERSYVNKFEVCKLLALLLDQGALEAVPVEDLRVLAEEAAREGNDDETVKFLQRLLDLGELDADLHIGLAQAFESLGELEKATCHQKLYAECCLEAGDTAAAVEAYSHIREVLPTDLFSRERRLQVMTEHGAPGTVRPEQILAEAREVAEIMTEVGQTRRAVTVLANAVSLVPEDLEARNQLAVLDLQAGFTTEAITEYRHIAAVKRARNDLEGTARTYRRILSIDRGQEEVLQQLESLVSVKKRRSARRRRTVLTAFITLLAAGAVYAVLLLEIQARGEVEEGEASAKALFAGHETVARRVLSRIESELARLRDRPDADPEIYLARAQRTQRACEESIQAVVDRYQQVIDRYPSTASGDQAVARIRNLELLREEVSLHERRARQKVQAKAQRLFESAKDLSSGGLLVPALEKYREARRLATEPTWIDSPEVELTRRIAEHETILEEARTIKADARALVEAGRVEEASAMLVRLLRTHSFVEIVRDVRLPVAITSKPDGARVIVPGHRSLSTPVTLEFRAREGLQVRLEAPGFEPTPLIIEPVDLSGSLAEIEENLPTRRHVDLRKGYQWMADADGALESAPLVLGDLVYTGSRSGGLACTRLDDGAALWSLELPTLGGVTSTPLIWNNLLLVTTSNPNRLLAVDPTERRIVWTYDNGGALGVVTLRPLLHRQSLYLSDDRGHVLRVELDRHRPWTKWQIRPGGEIRGRMTSAGEVILVPSMNGLVYDVELVGGRVRSSLRVGSPVTAAPVLSGSLLLVPSSDGKLRAFERGSNRVAWTAQAGGELRSPPIVVGDRVMFGALDGVLRIVDLMTGDPIASFRTGGPLAASPTAVNDLVFVTSHDGRIYATDLTEDGLVLRWTYRTGARITASPVWAAKYVLVASEDGHLYALSP